MIAIILVLFVLIVIFAYWYKYRCIDQIDKIIMNPTKQLLVLSLCVITVFSLLIFVGQLMLGETNDASIVVFLYGLFSQTTSAYNPAYDIDFQIFSVLVSVIGAVFFSGILVSTITNSILCRVGDYKEGKIHYKQLHKHDIIIGVNEIVPAVVSSLKDRKRKILIVSEKSADTVKKMLYKVGSDVINNQIIIYNEHPLNPDVLRWLCLEKCNSITILGEQSICKNDSENVIFLDALVEYINVRHSKITIPIKCYVSYYDSYRILNYCRDEKSANINIIPFNFYAVCVNNVWGTGQLFNKITDVDTPQMHSTYNYIPLFNGAEESKRIVILGYSMCAEEVIKFILLNAHTNTYKTDIILVTTNVVDVERFRYRFHIDDIKDVSFTHNAISEFSKDCRDLINSYAELGNLYIVCSGEDTDKNMLLVNSLPKNIYRNEIPVLVNINYFMPCNAPLDNNGKPISHIMFFGHFDQKIYETIDFELKTAQSIRYIHSKNLTCQTWNTEDDNSLMAYKHWFGGGKISKQIDIPKMNVMSRASFTNTILDILGIEMCNKREDMGFDRVLPLDKFLPIFHYQQCAFYVLSGYVAAEETNYKTKELSFIVPYSNVENDNNIIDSYIRCYNDIKTWLELNNLGIRHIDINHFIPTLNRKDIFADQLMDGKVLLYAPLANIVVEMEYDEMLLLEQNAKTGSISYDLISLFNKDEKIYRSHTPTTITELSILINQRCNFSCEYCYSANGRDNKEMSKVQLIGIIDWFINPNRGLELDIIFSGGGDPILSFGLMRQGIEYALEKAKKSSIRLNIGIVTNGSMLTNEQMDFISQHKIGLVVSFDIIKEVHNAQRSHYDIVVATIDELCRRNIDFGIRSTITPMNVTRQMEMVEVLHQRFPSVRSAAFEVVLNKALFANSRALDEFYLDFEKHLFDAQALGKSYGITIGNTIINNVNTCKERACLGKLVATPYGDITACSRISSSKEAYFDKFVYGHINANSVNINNEIINDILDKNVIKYPECSSCIAKWHCSGGCLLARYNLPKEYFKCYCRFMRRMVVHSLKQQVAE